jgi:hypothetical protein
MFSIVGKFDRRPNSGRTRRTLLSSLVCALLFLIGFVGESSAAKSAGNTTSTPVSSGPQLAISDFDGDFHPDLASVQAGATAFGSTDYWIQLQLSSAGRQSIRLVAPAGGLLIEARDVNGDHAVDLILSTSSRQPVAVFLNDGHGNFSRVASSAFPGAFSKPSTNWASAFDRTIDTVGVPPQSRSGVCRAAKALTNSQYRPDLILPSEAEFAFDSFVVSHAGRAPPV